MDYKYLEHIALEEITSIYCYKILLLLITKEYTQAQLSKILNLKTQNTSKYVKELENINLIEVSKIEGRNKFFKAVTNLENIPGEKKCL